MLGNLHAVESAAQSDVSLLLSRLHSRSVNNFHFPVLNIHLSLLQTLFFAPVCAFLPSQKKRPSESTALKIFRSADAQKAKVSQFGKRHKQDPKSELFDNSEAAVMRKTWQLVTRYDVVRSEESSMGSWMSLWVTTEPERPFRARQDRKSSPTRALIRVNSAPCFMPFMAFSVLFNQFVCWY